MKKILSAAAVATAALSAAAFTPAAAHADTYRGFAASEGCMVFLGSNRIGGHDYVEYRASNPGSRACELWMRTYPGKGAPYDHDWGIMTPHHSYNSGTFRDSGVKTQACVDVPFDSGSTACTVPF